MRKSAILLIFMIFFAAACSDGGADWDADPSIGAGSMDEISIISSVQSGVDGSSRPVSSPPRLSRIISATAAFVLASMSSIAVADSAAAAGNEKLRVPNAK